MITWPNFVSQLFNGLATGALLALISSGLTIIYGTLGVLNLAHGAMFMLGGYAGYVAFQATGSFVVAMIAGALFLVVVGIVIELVIIRHFYGRPAEDQLLVTFGIGIVVVELVRFFFGSLSKTVPPPWWGAGVTPMGFLVYPTYRIVVLAIAAAALGVLYVVLYRTRLGMIVRAGIEDLTMVGMLGINVYRVFMVVFGIGAMAAGFAGIVNAPVVSLTPDMGEAILVQTFVVIVIGGVGSFTGAILGGLIAGEILSLTSMVDPAYSAVMLFAAMTLVLLVRPQGLLGLPSRERAASAMMGRRPLLIEALTALGLLLAPFVLPAVGFAPNTVNQILIWGLFGIGFDILFGYTGLLSFGQAAFFGTGGMFAAYLLTNNLMTNVIGALVIGTLGASVAGVIVGAIALRRTGIYFAMITVAIAEMFYFTEFSPLAAYTGGENGLAGVPTPRFALFGWSYQVGTGWSMYGFLAVCYFLGIVVALRIVRSPVGAILIAIRDNPLRARAVGHGVGRYKLTAFVIAAAYAGFAGGLLGVLQNFMPPDAFAFDTSGQLVMQTAIGGIGTLFGPLLGATVWLFLRDFLQGAVGLGAAWKLVLGVVFVLLVCFLRRGLIGGLRDLVEWVAARRRPPPPEEAPELATVAPLASGGPARRRQDKPFSGPALEARGLTKMFGGLAANRDIDVAVEQGELRAIIGPNGAGKSTFFKMLTSELRPTSGRVLFHGRDITGMDVADVCQLGLTKSYQVNQLFPRLTLRENIVVAALAERRGSFALDLLRRIDRVQGLDMQVESTLALVGLTDRADVPVAELAYGEKRRLEIGLALASSPTLLLLDEPLAGMSPRERAETVQLLKNIRRGRTLIVVDHDMDAVFELAERITVLHEGALLAEGTPAEIQRNALVQEAYLGGVAAA